MTRTRIRLALPILALALLGTLTWLLPRTEAARLKAYYVTLFQDAQVVTISPFDGTFTGVPPKTVTRRDHPAFFSFLQEAMRRGAVREAEQTTRDTPWALTVTDKNGRRTEVVVDGWLWSRDQPKSGDLRFRPVLANGKEGIADRVTELMGAPKPSH